MQSHNHPCGGEFFDISDLSNVINLGLSFFIRSGRFVDAYKKGLDGKQAAWAIKKYRGHCVLPKSIMRELESNITELQFIISQLRVQLCIILIQIL
ncbi:uncharacterized protein F5147DRAFT_574503 [Suillus discolor]|uniref:Uncharacterized protein n=1 Tax=Suillus discolor TaxID=1912936 RepID=A0A9P7JV10_9AGAM|nr:uncharacterized protein F5147DRAFT_574503 [Suillus discolor]KAG2110643.1 hypothetical protein F5147DRAFT_574503 [Suillus discolor]